MVTTPLISLGVQAQSGANPTIPQPFLEEQRQQERERALREQNDHSVDTLRPAPPAPPALRLPVNESPCFHITQITLEGEDSSQFQWILNFLSNAGDGGAPDTPLGRCLGTQGVNGVLTRAQNALIAAGWITTRVLAGAQDLSSGQLRLTLVPGRIAALRTPEGGAVPLAVRAALPGQVGQLLNLRDVEQALENLKRLPTQDADIQVAPSTAPGARPGDSDLVVKYSQAFPLRLNLGLDDSGTQATGKTQGNATLAWDGPLGLNDLLYLNLNHDLFNHSGQGTQGGTLHYSVPWGDWLLGATYSQSQYHQTVAGYSQNYVYGGQSSNGDVRLTRLLYRDQSRKTSVSLRAWGRSARNFIDDTEIQVQHRIVGGWEAALSHRELFAVPAGRATLDANLAYREGTGAFGATPAPEELFGEGTSRLRLVQADAALNVPFKLGEQAWRYAVQWRAQWNQTPLTPQDRFAIGGRYTVRGFDGEASLMAERGWLVRNDLGWAVPGGLSAGLSAELYLGLDYGEVGGLATRYLLGRRLAGGVLGLRGALRQLSYDVFVGAPIVKPEGFRTARVTSGFNLGYSF